MSPRPVKSGGQLLMVEQNAGQLHQCIKQDFLEKIAPKISTFSHVFNINVAPPNRTLGGAFHFSTLGQEGAVDKLPVQPQKSLEPQQKRGPTASTRLLYHPF